MNITFRQLNAFIAVADTQSFTLAAKRLHLSQSALSGLIKELEHSMGVKLFDRTTRQTHLSVVGEQLLPQARRVLNELITLTQATQALTSFAEGHIKLAVSQQFAASTLPKIMASFYQQYPNIKVDLLDCSVEEVLGHVVAGEVDLGVGAERPFGDEVVATFLFALPFCVVLPPKHVLLDQPEVSWQDLHDLHEEKLISLKGPFNQRLASDLPPQLATRIAAPDIEVTFLSTALGMTAQGLGLTLCLPFASEWVRQQGLQLRALHHPKISRRFVIYHRKTRTLSPAATIFATFLQQSLQQMVSQGEFELAEFELTAIEN